MVLLAVIGDIVCCLFSRLPVWGAAGDLCAGLYYASWGWDSKRTVWNCYTQHSSSVTATPPTCSSDNPRKNDPGQKKFDVLCVGKVRYTKQRQTKPSRTKKVKCRATGSCKHPLPRAEQTMVHLPETLGHSDGRKSPLVWIFDHPDSAAAAHLPTRAHLTHAGDDYSPAWSFSIHQRHGRLIAEWFCAIAA